MPVRTSIAENVTRIMRNVCSEIRGAYLLPGRGCRVGEVAVVFLVPYPPTRRPPRILGGAAKKGVEEEKSPGIVRFQGDCGAGGI